MHFPPDHGAQPVFYVLLSLGIKHVDQSGQMLVVTCLPHRSCSNTSAVSRGSIIRNPV